MDSIIRDVGDMDAADRKAVEHVIGRRLGQHQQVIFSIIDRDASNTDQSSSSRPAQTIEDWTRVFDGLAVEDIEAIDKIAKTRAELARDLP